MLSICTDAFNDNVLSSAPSNVIDLLTVNVLLSVPANVNEFCTISAFPSANVNVDDVVGGVIVTRLTEFE